MGIDYESLYFVNFAILNALANIKARTHLWLHILSMNLLCIKYPKIAHFLLNINRDIHKYLFLQWIPAIWYAKCHNLIPQSKLAIPTINISNCSKLCILETALLEYIKSNSFIIVLNNLQSLNNIWLSVFTTLNNPAHIQIILIDGSISHSGINKPLAAAVVFVCIYASKAINN